MTAHDATAPLRQLVSACALVLLILPATTTPTRAAFYKCVATDGSVTYNDASCEADESTHVLSKSARELSVLDCRIAQNFAFDTVARMRQEDSTADVIDAYGGAANVSTDAVTLINYVFSFDNVTRVSSQRIVELTIERCRTGRLGKNLDQCGAFPTEFIKRLGGCTNARKSGENVLIQSQGADQLSGISVTTDNPGTPPTLKAAQPVENTPDVIERPADDDITPDISNP
ncbi:MAG: hypothetical protein AB8B97_20920 [Granulosicoccus sp.]